MTQDYLSIRALTAYLKRKFDADPYLTKVAVTGELSNVGRRRGQHLYFSIKDPDGSAVISAAMFSYAKRLPFTPEEGMKITATGRVQVYERNGSYSLIVDQMSPDGVGALFLAYEQLKQQLQKEGLFDQPKQRMPYFPRRIAVVTSPTGAVIEDISRTVQRRFGKAQVVLFPAKVQGDGAAEAVTAQLKRIDATGDYDVIIVGRGGGSIEDLWAFNDEELVRTVAQLATPVISSVGHETDTTLVDFVADQRAATPTAAAELATPVTRDYVQQRLGEQYTRLQTALRQRLRQDRERLDRLQNHVIFRQPDRLYTGYAQRTDQLAQRLQQSFERRVATERRRCDQLEQRYVRRADAFLAPLQQRCHIASARLHAVSPLAVLGRGYAIATDQGTVIKRAAELTPDQNINLRFSDGEAMARITAIQTGEKHD